MTAHKATSIKARRTALAVIAIATVAAAVFGGAVPQIGEAAQSALGVIKAVACLSAGRLPANEAVPNSDDELENLVVPPSGAKSYIFRDIESSDEGADFAAETHETSDSLPSVDENPPSVDENPPSVDGNSADEDNSSQSSTEVFPLHIRNNIADFDDDLDYAAVGNKSGYIARYTYTTTQDPTFITLSGGAQVRNCTYVTNEALEAESTLLPEFEIQLNGAPQVLIMHTHTTESYEPYERSYFDAEFPYRSRDSRHNVIAVGEKIAEKLAAAGIGVVHDGTLHDYPSYNGAYARSEETVRAYLEKYPSIKVVLDVHRDALESEEGVRIAPVAEINGRKSAQIMIISGCDDGSFGMPDYMQNFRLACLFQNKLSMYSGLTRAVLFDYRKYNQHLTTGSLLLEIGGHANSLDEALYCGELTGEKIAEALLTLAKAPDAV